MLNLFHTKKSSPIQELSSVELLIAFGSSFVITIWAAYLKGFFTNDSNIGFFSSLLAIFIIGTRFYLIPFLEKHKPSVLFTNSLGIEGIILIILSVCSNFYLFLFVIILWAIVSTVRTSVNGVLIRMLSHKKTLAKNESLIYTFYNIGFLIGPLIAGFFAEKYGINGVLAFGGIMYLIAFMRFKLFRIDDHYVIPKKLTNNVRKNLIEFFKNHDLRIAFLFSAGIASWWSVILLYVPLYIIKSSLPLSYIGYFIFATGIPLIILEYYIATKAVFLRYKNLIIPGYLIMSICSLFAYLFSSMPFIFLSFLVLASFGAAFVEPLREAYFFSLIPKSKSNKYYGVFLTSANFGGLLGKFVPALILLFLPFQFIFIFLSIAMIFFAYISTKMRNI